MNLRKNKVLCLLFCLVFSSSLLARDLHPYWYQLPEKKYPQVESEDKSLFSFRRKLKIILKSQQNSLESSQDKNTKSGWKLDGVNTTLGLGLSGKIGVLSWGGTKTVELFWHKKSGKKDVETKTKSTILFNEKMNKTEAQQSVEPIIRSLVSLGKVKDESNLRKNLYSNVDKFLSMTQAVAKTAPRAWVASKIRLDLTVSAEGSVTGIVTKLGGDIRLRFEWSRTQAEKANKDVVLDQTQRAIKGLVDGFSSELSKANFEKMEKLDYDLAYVRLGIAVSAKGDVGILKGSAGFAPFVYLKPVSNKMVQKDSLSTLNSFDLFVSTPQKSELQFAKDNNLGFKEEKRRAVFSISSRKFRKGMEKAVKFASRTAGSVQKIVKRDGKWGIKKIRSSFAFSLSGDVGVVSLKGVPSIELEFKNKNF